MIILQNLTEDNRAEVRFYGPEFQEILRVLRSQVASKWDADKRTWSVPLTHINFLLSDFFINKIETPVLWGSQLFSVYLDVKKIIRKQIKIKNLPLDTNIIKYNKFLNDDVRLRPFQTVGCHFLYSSRFIGGCLLADVVGIGKTPQAIVATTQLMHTKESDNTIVICPSSLKRKWHDDLIKFLKKVNIFYVDGTPQIRQEIYEKFIVTNNSYLIVNYDLAINDWQRILFPLLEEKKKNIVCIFDEAQYLKNHASKRAIFCRELVEKYSSINYGLSATYLETSLMDIFNIFATINPNALGTKVTSFIDQYVELDYMGKECGVKNSKLLVKRLSPYNIRRHKEQISDQLPDRIEEVYWVTISGKQKQCYDEILKGVIENIKGKMRKEQVSVANILSQYSYLIQTCLSTALMDYEHTQSAKLDLLLELIEQFVGEKILVFCHFTKMVDIIYDSIKNKGYNVLKAKGGTHFKNAKAKQELIDKFNADSNIKCLVSSDVFKEGVDIVGASVVVNFDLLWNPATMEQRAGRIDRIVGQKAEKIYVLNLITQDTIEEQIWDRLYHRGKVFTEVVDDGYVSTRIKKKDLLSMVNIEDQ